MELQQIQEQEQREVDRLALLESGTYNLDKFRKHNIDCVQFQIVEASKEAEKAKSTQPSGQGDTFSPGEWNPSSKR